MHTYINAVLSAIYMYDMYVYIYRYIYKVASKNGFLILQRMQSFSLSHTSRFNDTLYFPAFPFLFTLPSPCPNRSAVSIFDPLLTGFPFSKVSRVNSLRYLRECLALLHFLPAVPGRCAIVGCEESSLRFRNARI